MAVLRLLCHLSSDGAKVHRLTSLIRCNCQDADGHMMSYVRSCDSQDACCLPVSVASPVKEAGREEMKRRRLTERWRFKGFPSLRARRAGPVSAGSNDALGGKPRASAQ